MTPVEINRVIESYIRPATFPLAIRMLTPGESAPPKARSPQKSFGGEVAVCQTYAIARRYGWALVLSRDDINCPLTKIAYGLDPVTESYASGETCEGMYNSTKEAGAKTEAAVPKFPAGKYDRILTAPLGKAEFEPHVVLTYGNSAQVMLLLAAALFEKGGYLTCRFSPRIDCSESVVRTMLTGEPQIILPCYGDRVVGQAQDDEMAFSFPWSRADDIARALPALHTNGVRYPIPAFLRYQPEFPPKYAALDAELKAKPKPSQTG